MEEVFKRTGGKGTSTAQRTVYASFWALTISILFYLTDLILSLFLSYPYRWKTPKVKEETTQMYQPSQHLL